MTHYCRYDSSGGGIGLSQTSTWQHTTRHIHATGGIRTRTPSKRALDRPAIGPSVLHVLSILIKSPQQPSTSNAKLFKRHSSSFSSSPTLPSDTPQYLASDHCCLYPVISHSTLNKFCVIKQEQKSQVNNLGLSMKVPASYPPLPSQTILDRLKT